MKKILAVILSVLMVLTALPLTATAALVKTSDDGLFDYKILYTDEQTDKTYIEIISYNDSESKVNIPYELDGYFVKGINGTFSGNGNIERVTFSEGVEYIEQSSFEQCIISIETPMSMRYIAPGAFAECEIIELALNEGLVAIDCEAFICCAFDCEVRLPDSLKYLGMAAFEECCIESAHIGKMARPSNNIEYSLSGKVTDGGVYPYEEYMWTPFYLNQCHIDVNVSDDNANLRLDGDILYTGDNSFLLACFGDPDCESVDIELPEGLSCVLNNVFPEGYKIGKLTISSTVEYIDYKAFYGTNIEELSFAPNSSLREIGDLAFTSCGVGGDLVIPKSVEVIGKYAFSENDIKSLDFELPSCCTEVYIGAFEECLKLKSVFIPNSINRLGSLNSTDKSEVFADCISLESVTFEDNSKIKYWGGNLFTNTAIKHFDTGKNNAVERLSGFDSSFDADVLDLSNCPGLKYIACSFENFRFREVNLANTALTAIPERCFSYCQKLEKITLPDTLTTINQYSFYYCDKLRDINVDAVINIGDHAFDECPSLPDPINERYEQNFGNFKYINLTDGVAITGYTGSDRNIIIPDKIDGLSVTKIANRAFEKSTITSVKLPKSLVTIGDNAFNKATLTTMPELPNSLIYIGSYAFSGIEFEGSLTIPDNVTVIGSFAFYDSKFSSIDLGKGVKSIAKKAFANIEAEEIIIPDSMTSLDVEFINCKKLRSIDFGSSSVDIESFFFNGKTIGEYDCLEEIKASFDNMEFATLDGVLYSKDMTRVIFFPNAKVLDTYTTPETVRIISSFAFSFASNLNNVIVGDSVRELREQVFYGTNIKNITISGKVENIGDEAFAESEKLIQVTFGDELDIPKLSKAFYNCSSLEEVTFGSNSVVGTMRETFAKSSVKNVTLPNSVTRLDNTFFLTKKLETVTMPQKLDAMIEAFSNSGIISIEIPETVDMITRGCFEYCERLSDVTLHGVSSIGAYAFCHCTSLNSIDLTGVTFVDETAFIGCDNLKKLYFTADEHETFISEYEFQGNDTVETIIVGNSITEIQSYAFADCYQLRNAFIADSVTEIADTAFDNCLSLNILCTDGSYAMEYAEKNSIPYTTFLVAPIPDQEYTGCEITPQLDVSAQSRALTIGTDFTAVYTDNINIGTAKVNVIGLGDYSIFACLTKFSIVAPFAATGDKPVQSDTQTGDDNATPNTPNTPDCDTAKNKPEQDEQTSVSSNITQQASSDTSSQTRDNDDAKTDAKNSSYEQNSVIEQDIQEYSQASVQESVQSDASSSMSGDTDNQTVQEESSYEDTFEEDLNWFKKFIIAIKNLFHRLITFLKSVFTTS